MSPLFVDALTVAHLAAMATGFGTVVFADCTMISRVATTVDTAQVAVLRRAHLVISAALLVMWLTGLSLLTLRTGLAFEELTPKLLTKLAVVSLLTLTAVTMARYALPRVASRVGRRLLDAPLPEKLGLAACSGMSATCWTMAVVLGGAETLKSAGTEVFWFAGTALTGGIFISLTLAYVVHRHLRASSSERSNDLSCLGRSHRPSSLVGGWGTH